MAVKKYIIDEWFLDWFLAAYHQELTDEDYGALVGRKKDYFIRNQLDLGCKRKTYAKIKEYEEKNEENN